MTRARQEQDITTKNSYSDKVKYLIHVKKCRRYSGSNNLTTKQHQKQMRYVRGLSKISLQCLIKYHAMKMYPLFNSPHQPATGWGFDSWQGLRIFPFSTASRPVLGPIQPPIQYVSSSFYGGKTAGA